MNILTELDGGYMRVYGIGADFGKGNISDYFIENGVVGIGWDKEEAPDLHNFFSSIRKDEYIYIKKANHSSKDGGQPFKIYAIGKVEDNCICEDVVWKVNDIEYRVPAIRKVKWITTEEFDIQQRAEKINVRANTLYQEFHPVVLNEIFLRVQKKA